MPSCEEALLVRSRESNHLTKQLRTYIDSVEWQAE